MKIDKTKIKPMQIKSPYIIPMQIQRPEWEDEGLEEIKETGEKENIVEDSLKDIWENKYDERWGKEK